MIVIAPHIVFDSVAFSHHILLGILAFVQEYLNIHLVCLWFQIRGFILLCNIYIQYLNGWAYIEMKK